MILAIAYIVLSLVNGFYMRQRFALCQRLNDVNWSAMVLLDIAVGFVLFSALYLHGIMKDRPRHGETISSFAGRNAGKGWADKLAAIIDAVFFVITSQREHCAKAARYVIAEMSNERT